MRQLTKTLVKEFKSSSDIYNIETQKIYKRKSA
jgi:hypothetical protein